MSSRLVLLVALVLVSSGCAFMRREEAPPPPGGILKVDVEKPTNASGVALPQQPANEMFGLVTSREPTVIESLGTQMRSQLQSRGFEVVTRKTPDVPELRTEIRRWEPYQVDYSLVTVDVTATLVDGKTGATIWSVQRSDWNVPTHGQPTPFDAALEATRRVAKDLLEDWTPATGATPQ